MIVARTGNGSASQSKASSRPARVLRRLEPEAEISADKRAGELDVAPISLEQPSFGPGIESVLEPPSGKQVAPEEDRNHFPVDEALPLSGRPPAGKERMHTPAVCQHVLHTGGCRHEAFVVCLDGGLEGWIDAKKPEDLLRRLHRAAFQILEEDHVNLLSGEDIEVLLHLARIKADAKIEVKRKPERLSALKFKVGGPGILGVESSFERWQPLEPPRAHESIQRKGPPGGLPERDDDACARIRTENPPGT